MTGLGLGRELGETAWLDFTQVVPSLLSPACFAARAWASNAWLATPRRGDVAQTRWPEVILIFYPVYLDAGATIRPMSTQLPNDYSEGSIRVLKGLEPVKQRPGMYTRTENPLHIIQEVIDNAADGEARVPSSRMNLEPVGVPAAAMAAAAWSCVEKMLQEAQRTCAPSACRVSISTAV